jgi:integrase
MRKRKLTEKSIKALKTTNARGIQVADTETRGFGVTVFPRHDATTPGRRVFWIRYRRPNGRGQRRYVLGDYGPLTVDDARKQAKLKLAEVLKGVDPAQEREKRKAVPTFNEWAAEYLKGVRLRKKHPRADVAYLAMACKRWGPRAVDTITSDDVAKLVQSYGERRRIAANRLLASIRACLGAAWRLDLIPGNPAAKVKPYRENPPRQRVLNDAELHAVLATVEKWPHQHERAAFLLLIHTGARLSEVLRARWEHVDLRAGEWWIPSPKAGHPQMVPLPADVVRMLRALDRLGELVIPGTANPDKPRYDLKKAWSAIRGAAGIPDVNVHDLRRTFGLRVARAAGVHVASKLLRHADVRVTSRIYAPLDAAELRAAAEEESRGLAKVLKMRPKPKASGEVG